MPRLSWETRLPEGGESPTLRDFVALQEELQNFLDQLYDQNPLLDSVLIEDETLSGSSADNFIAHGLDRAYKHIVPVRFSVATTWTLGDNSTAFPADKFVNFVVGTATTVSFLVF